MAWRFIGLAMLLSAGCATYLNEDFEGYAPRPTHCDLAASTNGDPRRALQCAGDETCAAVTADLSSSSSEARCVRLSDRRPESAACEFANDCGADGFCSLAGCLRYCRIDDATPCASGACLRFAQSAPVIEGVEYGYCAPSSCDPLKSACGAGRTCQFHQPTWATCFYQTGRAAKGAACATSNDCAPGLACGPEQRCTEYCRIGGDDCSGKDCLAGDEGLSLEGRAYGYCAF